MIGVSPNVFARIPLMDAAFIMAHELLHLALDTHGRQGRTDPHLVNVAHDYVINDMLAADLGRNAPLGGLVRPGARDESLERLIVELSRGGKGGRRPVWAAGGPRRRQRRQKAGKSSIRQALEDAGLMPQVEEPPPPEDPEPDWEGKTPLGDLIPAGDEAAMEPDITPEQRRKLRQQVKREAAKALSLGQLRAKLDETADQSAKMTDPERGERMMDALRVAYAPPWQRSLQRWLDAVAPAGRTYSRASRRGAERDDDVILCGRFREGWCLHIVLDTSGSMTDALPKVLGTIGAFCDAANVSQVHVIQCDVEVTRDEWLEPPELGQYKIAGFGGSDMSPGLRKLAEDSEVAAVLVLTDGYISYPAQEPPYAILWGLFRSGGYCDTNFKPSYGEVLFVDV
jgi:predicted metal-dependent peptidase